MSFRGLTFYKDSTPGLTAKLFNKLIPEAYESAVELWHDKYLPFHFESFAESKYNYRRRSAETNKKKRRNKRPEIALVDSGELKQSAIRSIEIKGNQKGAKGHLKVPKYAWIIQPSGLDMIDEMMVTLPSEVNNMYEKMDEIIQTKILDVKSPKKIEH